MSTEEIQELELKVRKARFILSQKASELHDLIEDRLPADYMAIPDMADAVYKACKVWDEMNQDLMKAKQLS
jgi:hypothetical protein